MLDPPPKPAAEGMDVTEEDEDEPTPSAPWWAKNNLGAATATGETRGTRKITPASPRE